MLSSKTKLTVENKGFAWYNLFIPAMFVHQPPVLTQHLKKGISTPFVYGMPRLDSGHRKQTGGNPPAEGRFQNSGYHGMAGLYCALSQPKKYREVDDYDNI